MFFTSNKPGGERERERERERKRENYKVKLYIFCKSLNLSKREIERENSYRSFPLEILAPSLIT